MWKNIVDKFELSVGNPKIIGKSELQRVQRSHNDNKKMKKDASARDECITKMHNSCEWFNYHEMIYFIKKERWRTVGIEVHILNWEEWES